MSKLTDAIISAMLKKGVLLEMRNVDTTFELPKTDLAEAFPITTVDDPAGIAGTPGGTSGSWPGNSGTVQPVPNYISTKTLIHLKAEHLTIKIDRSTGEE